MAARIGAGHAKSFSSSLRDLFSSREGVERASPHESRAYASGQCAQRRDTRANECIIPRRAELPARFATVRRGFSADRKPQGCRKSR